MQSASGLDVSHAFFRNRIPLPLPSHRRSGALPCAWFAWTRSLASGPPPATPPSTSTMPPEKMLSLLGTLPVTVLPKMTESVTPTPAMPMPEVGGPSSAGQEFVLFLTVFERMSQFETPPGESVSSIRKPTQLPCALLAFARPCEASRKKNPLTLPDDSLRKT